MSVYKIFPTADTTLYSAYPDKNAGLDEILEVSVKNNIASATYMVPSVTSSAAIKDDLRRSIIFFSDQDISTIQGFATGSWQAGLKLYLANAENLETTYSVEVGQVASNWDRGTGKFADYPDTINGACWYSPTYYVSSSNSWTAGTSSYYLTPGGGDYLNNFVQQDFGYKDSKDLNVDVTYIVNHWFSRQYNRGFLIKHIDSVENDPNSYIALSFFSVDTHTIYPPTLEMRWDDSSYTTGSLSVINNNQFLASIDNNLCNFKYNTQKYRFKVNARDKYPARSFATSSIYTVNKALPKESYWALQDLKTEDMLIDFDTTYTKISCDGTNSYFDVYMKGLEPERYYKILMRVNLPDGESIELDNNYIFKIIR